MWWYRFVNRTDAYAKQGIKDGQCQYFATYQPVTAVLFEAHLIGAITLGLPALDQNGFSRWCCFDSDNDDGCLDKIEQLLIQCGWCFVREGQRPTRPGHLWLFFAQPVPASDLRLIGNRFLEVANARHIELFPKMNMPTFDTEKQRFKASSIVRLPLGVHRKPGVNDRGWFRDAERNLDQQIQYICDQPFNPAEPVQKLAEELRQLASAKNAIRYPVRSTIKLSNMTPLEYYIRELPELTGNGMWRNCRCPFHSEEHPSFGVNVETGAFNCFACGARGKSIYTFHLRRYEANGYRKNVSRA